MKKFLVSAVSFLIGTALAVTGALAYVSSELAVAESTSTTGEIVQLEYQRAQDHETETFQWNNIKLVPFVKDKLLSPAAPVAAAGGVLSSSPGVQDKLVFVQNQSDNSVFFRTYIAFEAGALTEQEFRNTFGYFINEDAYDIDPSLHKATIDGDEYYVVVATYKGALATGEVSEPSLLQFYMKSATSELIRDKIGDQYKVTVVSEACDVGSSVVPAEALNNTYGTPAEVLNHNLVF